jgi:alcohol dehydrogenase class IV
VLSVAPGRVDELAAALLGEVGERPLVALGGGRIIDVAKALAGATGTRCAALPTTLSGAPLTPFHRMPAGLERARLVRPALVVADPRLAASQPRPARAASAMNAMAHALESLYAPLRNPVAELAALRGAALLAAGLRARGPAGEGAPAESGAERALALALGALLAGYAIGSTGLGFHHALCQTIVRSAGTPHAETNAVMLPRTAAFMAPRAPRALGALADALGDRDGGPDAAGARLRPLAALSGRTRLSELGVGAELLPAIAASAARHPAVATTPGRPSRAELLRLLEAAL